MCRVISFFLMSDGFSASVAPLNCFVRVWKKKSLLCGFDDFFCILVELEPLAMLARRPHDLILLKVSTRSWRALCSSIKHYFFSLPDFFSVSTAQFSTMARNAIRILSLQKHVHHNSYIYSHPFFKLFLPRCCLIAYSRGPDHHGQSVCHVS